MERTRDGFTVEVVPIHSDKWDYRITIKHPEHIREWLDLVSGKYPVIVATRNRLLREVRALHLETGS